MGTHISRIKSTSLDRWDQEWIELFKKVDNSIMNAFWEHTYTEDINLSNDNSLFKFIRNKYEKKL